MASMAPQSLPVQGKRGRDLNCEPDDDGAESMDDDDDDDDDFEMAAAAMVTMRHLRIDCQLVEGGGTMAPTITPSRPEGGEKSMAW